MFKPELCQVRKGAQEAAEAPSAEGQGRHPGEMVTRGWQFMARMRMFLGQSKMEDCGSGRRRVPRAPV